MSNVSMIREVTGQAHAAGGHAEKLRRQVPGAVVSHMQRIRKKVPGAVVSHMRQNRKKVPGAVGYVFA